MLYRNLINGRYDRLELKLKHTNMLVGYCEGSIASTHLYSILQLHLVDLYTELEAFIAQYPEFEKTLNLWEKKSDHQFINNMIAHTALANVGPMASVAGTFSDEILNIGQKYCAEVFVENGGDVALKNRKEVSVMIYPGWGNFKSKVSLRIPAGHWGIASSSGQFGPSLSVGEAEMVSVVAENASKADAFATSIANQIVPGCQPLNILKSYHFLDAVSIIWKGNIWYKGKFELVFQ